MGPAVGGTDSAPVRGSLCSHRASCCRGGVVALLDAGPRRPGVHISIAWLGRVAARPAGCHALARVAIWCTPSATLISRAWEHVAHGIRLFAYSLPLRGSVTVRSYEP